ncbi:hypothetical protein M947_07825 [Sulfurimonas hongkongensis]|uniref:Uncharacterized protein n=1 Tax=Sulfurimonas hongkongensis TaxID=1172190 RepID=T0JEC1_9BACT|nr:hypothetical protein [Sulfurimonas hongkongensis]EQB39360.1 hypothetical protein M947_07825 [Sulfurimonas hongkongensis]
MKLSKIVSKIKKYLEDENLTHTKQEKIEDIIEKLSLKKIQLKQDIKSCDTQLQKEKMQKELEAISTLLKKSKRLIERDNL